MYSKGLPVRFERLTVIFCKITSVGVGLDRGPLGLSDSTRINAKPAFVPGPLGCNGFVNGPLGAVGSSGFITFVLTSERA